MALISFDKVKPLLFSALMALVIIGCAKVTNKGQKAMSYGTCEGCHTDYDHLKLVYTPDTAAPAGGCGGSAPHIEPYDRVFMDGDGYAAYQASTHAMKGCTGCHNGTDMTTDKELAHSGDFLKHPSMEYEDKCGSCHSAITGGFTTNLHHGIGQKDKVTKRSGLSGHQDFDLLPQHQIDGYNANCATCHGTCGNCHVVRPPLAGGGLSQGHNFTEPDMLTTCIKCHSSRGAHAYLGLGPNTEADIHLTKNGWGCTDCHDGQELHGNGEPVDHRYAYTELPSCDDCHTSENMVANTYHNTHIDDFNCHVCHSQDYNNCGSCHIHGDGARIPSYQGFKIAMNPIPDVKNYEFALVRRTLAAPDNFAVYGIDDYTNFDVFPTYNYATPHNIQRWTSRTNEGGSCSLNCHIRNEQGNLINLDLYLWEDSLETWAFNATKHITVDGKLSFPGGNNY